MPRTDTPITPTEIREFVVRLRDRHADLGANGKKRARNASLDLVRAAQEIESAEEVAATKGYWDRRKPEPEDE